MLRILETKLQILDVVAIYVLISRVPCITGRRARHAVGRPSRPDEKSDMGGGADGNDERETVAQEMGRARVVLKLGLHSRAGKISVEPYELNCGA